MQREKSTAPPPSCVLHVNAVSPSARRRAIFPSKLGPKWMCISPIIFCHYSFWLRQCEDVQTFLAVESHRFPRRDLNLKKCERSSVEELFVCLFVHLSWNCLDGIKPARGLACPSSLACHQVGSSWLMIWRMAPFWKASPASLHGMALSSLGS